MKLSRAQMEKIHARCSLHLAELRCHPFHSCFYCCRRIDGPAVKDFTDCGLTAICPECGIDAILPGEYPGYVLLQMHERYFK